MNSDFQIWLGVALFACVALTYLWQNPGLYRSRMGAAEIDAAMAEIEKLPLPPDERAELLLRARHWLETDDGKPVYMLNLMRFFPAVRQHPGARSFEGSPQESNALYERVAIPLLLKLGGYPLYAGVAQGANLLEYAPELDKWNRVLVVRYPSRRSFIRLVTSAQYRQVAHYKLMALSVVLTPTSSELQIPNLTLLIAGVSSIIFLAVGWWQAASALAAH